MCPSRLQPGCDVHRVAEGYRMAFRPADHADCHLPAVYADAHPQIRKVPGLPHLVRVAVDGPHDAQGCSGCPVCIVFVCRRKTEEGGDPVAHIGVNDTAVLLDRATHPIDASADQCREVLRRQSLGERRGTHDVGEQRAHWSQLVLSCDGGRRRSLQRRGCAVGWPDGNRQHLDAGRPDLDHIPGREGHRAGDAFAVHPGSVERSEVLDLEPLAGRSENRVRS